METFEMTEEEAEVVRACLARCSAEGVLRRPLYDRLMARMKAPEAKV